MLKNAISFVFLFLICIYSSFAQRYRLFTSDNELPSSMVSYIYQDHYGFMWFATENGLVKYDGARFITYSHIPSDSTSIAHDFVTSLVEDNDGNLYVSTYEGVQVYNHVSNNFTPNVTWEDGSPFGENTNYLFVSSEGMVYSVGFSLSLLKYDGNRVYAKKIENSNKFKHYSKLQEDNNKSLWLSVNDTKKIIKIEDGRFVKEYDICNSKGALNDFVVTQDGAIFASVHNEGIKEYNRYTDKFEVLIPELSNEYVTGLYSEGDKLYLTGEQIPIYIYDRKKKSLSEFYFEFGKSSLKENHIQRVLFDNGDNIWISIAQIGVMMVPSDNSPFHYIGSRYADSDLIGKAPITSIFVESKGSTLFGTSGDGVYCLSSDQKEVKHFDKPYNVNCFFEYPDGIIWMGGPNSGVSCYNIKTGKVEQDALRYDEGHVSTIHDIDCDNQGRMWLGSMGLGLLCYDTKRERTFSVNQINPNIHKWVCKTFVSGNGSVWLGTYDGLEKVNINSEKYENERFLKRSIVYDILQDKRQTLWVATSAGLFNMTNTGDTIKQYTTEDGLPTQSLSSLQIDSEGMIWVSSNLGLSKVDPINGNVINFFSGDGLQGNEFCKASSFCDSRGRLWFGGINGVSYFTPNDVHNDNNPWHVRIVAFSIGDNEMTSGPFLNRKKSKKTPIFEAENVEIEHKDNSFTVFFATKELNCPDKLQFEYKMNEQPWRRLPVGVHSVSFSNLASGSYDFSVRAINNQRGSTIHKVHIVITPLWYQRWWAKILFLLLTLAFLAVIFLYVRSHYREKNDRLLAEKQQAMHDAQTRFFIDITHEIRTPLTLILGPIRKLLATDNDFARQSSYATIQRNANRILRLMNQMIDMRKVEKGVLNLHFVEKNIGDLVKNVYVDFLEQARLKNIDLSYNILNDEDLLAWVDPDYFDKIVINLVSNALKYTQVGGKVDISLKKNNKDVVIVVKDNGPGVPLSERERIFDRFYRGKYTDGTMIQGSGIGLALTRSLVEKHHGMIELESSTDEPTGSTFTVTIPLGKEHLADSEIVVPIALLSSQNEEKNVFVDFNTDQKIYSKTKYRILVVDDEDDILAYLVKELSSDFHVSSSHNGKEAFEKLQQYKCDLVITDVMMPVLDGENLCRKIRSNINLNHIPIVMLTANTEESAIISGLDCGADEYLTKPISIDLLRTRIYNLIHSRERLYNSFTGKQIEEEKLEEIHLKTPDEQLMERIMKVINSNLANPDLSVEMLADKIGMSRVHLNRKLKELTNQTARDFIRNVRLKQAAILLSQGDHPINTVAELVGFTNSSNFTTAFKNLYGVSPKDYK